MNVVAPLTAEPSGAASGTGAETAGRGTGAGTPGDGGGPARSAGPDGARGWVRQWRAVLITVAIVVVTAAVPALLRPAPGVAGYLSPQGTDPFGAKAISDIMGRRGHPVDAEATVAGAVSRAQAGGTLVITSPDLLSGADLRALRAAGADLMIVEPTQRALAVLAPRVSLSGGTPVATLAPGCTLRAARLAGPALLGGPGLRVSASQAGGVAQCYPEPSGPTLVRYRAGGRLITVLSSGVPLANVALGRQGDAALAINLLSAAGPVTWLVPDPLAAQGAATPSLTSVLPRGVNVVAAQLAVALLLTAAWRARRLGPLVTERLPVVVRASETVEGHGRLYRSRRARDRVAEQLRAATAGRLRPAAGLPPGAGQAAVTAALAARSTLDEARIAGLLYGPAPRTDAELVALADDLDALEGEVLST